ncbi:hypothetical protein EZ428_23070 [Pedobacter frigiditerrae]|uniref:Uncharacterized protein n=1 Tax=Pedobacter frigiditerrae TaxID=2530452 RepID=A0A4R0MKG0_9SPHI|nr:hypothetical protein [Pedobacter frigiditerrae]TCC87081.1 hypothetical protein EZ428_23070 [Pedobacter frigiditerrae]
MEYKISYPVYIWLTSAWLGALLFFIGLYVINSYDKSFNLGDTIVFYFLTVIIGAFVSVPALVILLLSLHLLSGKFSSYFKLKIAIAIIATITCIGVFLCFGVYFTDSSWPIMLAYIIPLVASVFFYEVNGKDRDYSNQLPDPS